MKKRIRPIIAILALVAIAALAQPGHPATPAAAQQSGYGWLQVDQVVVSVPATVGTTSASARTSGSVMGHIYAINLDYGASVTSTADITISQATPALTIQALTDTYTDTWYYPEAQATGSTGSAISGAYDRLPVGDRLTVAAAEMISNTTVTATIYWGQ